MHEVEYDYMEVKIPFSSDDMTLDTAGSGYCFYEFRIYPSSEFEEYSQESFTVVMTVISACVFFVIAMAFFLYDLFVQQRNAKVIAAAAKTNALVLSLFPAQIRDQLLKEKDLEGMKKQKKSKLSAGVRGFLDGAEADQREGPAFDNSKPIAGTYIVLHFHFAFFW